jgi:hypothetical protein
VDATVTIGVPFDSVGRGGGTETAPAVLRDLGLPQALGARSEGDLAVRIRGEQRDPETGLMASDDVLESTAIIRTAVAAAIEAGERPFLLGGCCAELPGALAGARDALGAPLGLAHLDGHLDLYDGETSTTGEAADMPISVVLGLGPAAWVEAAGGAAAVPERTALVGFRDRAESIADGMRQPEDLAIRRSSTAPRNYGRVGSPRRRPSWRSGSRRARFGSTSTSTSSTKRSSRPPTVWSVPRSPVTTRKRTRASSAAAGWSARSAADRRGSHAQNSL